MVVFASEWVRRFFLIPVVVAAGLCLPFGQSTLASQSTAASAAQITQDSVLGHLEFLASDALQGRGSGTRDEEIAATYIGAYFRRLGLEPMADTGGFVQRIEVIRETASAPPTVAAGTRLGGVTGATPRVARVTLDADTHAAMAALPSGTVVTIDAALTGTSSSTWNAMARLTGADAAQRAEVIVLGAHLDHVGRRETATGEDKIFNGADDDASGTVAVMELAAAFAAGPRPKRTMVFALFGSEEAGGFGAGYFVDKPVVAHNAMIAQIQFEMLGRADSLVPTDHLWLTGYERSNLGAELAKRGARVVQDPRPDQSFFTRSDNIRFARKGIVAHTVSSFNLHKDYHQVGDEVSKIDLAHMTRSIQSMLEPIRWLANSTFKPEWAPGGRPQ